MFLNDFITIVAVNEGVIPDNQRRDQLALFEDIFFKLKPVKEPENLLEGDYLLIFNSYNKTLFYNPAKKAVKADICPDVYKNLSYERTLQIGNIWFDVYKINGNFLPN